MDTTGPGRFQPPPPTGLDASQSAFYRRLVDGPRGRAGDVPLVDASGALVGPFALMAIAPDLGEAVQQVGAAVRYASALDPVVREAAVLLVASHHRCAFEWHAHEDSARKLGLDDRQLDQLRGGTPPSGLPKAATRALLTVNTMLRTASLDDDAYADTVAELGERGLAELVWLTGYYSMLALALAVFDPPNPLGPER
ncbi:carboxymuconolactone decarboxylase family protein [Kutzneria albida]|uniref:carboxymuconolactone decarboxylase family protein n=1 Tax=Kutzneria albida TaxID=43357 RepID=UPI00046D583C|nr:carboxymuconolactone decarboxylase family protein [Kutzneria albida]